MAEIDYLLHLRLGADAAFEFLEAVELGDFEVVPLTRQDLALCRDLAGKYRDLSLGLADSTLVAAAERLGVYRLLTLDHRHFRTVTPRNFSHFTLFPFDAE